MHRNMPLAATVILALAAAVVSTPSRADTPKAQHVLLISVDGLHAVDLANFVKSHPNSALATLSKSGLTYSQAWTPVPSDSFPGMLALITGATPKSTGVYYDVSYDRKLAAPNSDCSKTGTEVDFDETADIAMDRLDAGGGLDPKKLPRDPASERQRRR
jgi:predicted AlkP superfamily pyrophosphatase or phosphodiesterase